jgi:hypothetical protein
MDDDRGISCPKCACRHCPESKTEVAKTIALGPNKSIQRVRVCRHCGKRFVTLERVIGLPVESSEDTGSQTSDDDAATLDFPASNHLTPPIFRIARG